MLIGKQTKLLDYGIQAQKFIVENKNVRVQAERGMAFLETLNKL